MRFTLQATPDVPPRVRLELLDVGLNSRDGGWLQYQRSREVVDAPFTLYSEPGRTVVMQPGDYEFDDCSIVPGCSTNGELILRPASGCWPVGW